MFTCVTLTLVHSQIMITITHTSSSTLSLSPLPFQPFTISALYYLAHPVNTSLSFSTFHYLILSHSYSFLSSPFFFFFPLPSTFLLPLYHPPSPFPSPLATSPLLPFLHQSHSHFLHVMCLQKCVLVCCQMMYM